jgi:ornithine cyclodeaminase/alanine dehydrogenase-like protein (mu-crystallin family)
VITALRTGAVGGVAIRHLSRADSRSVGVVGCGVQGLHQLMYACAVRDIGHIYLYDAFLRDFEPFMQKVTEALAPKNVDITVCKSADEVLEESDIVITATQAKEPLFSDDETLLKGKCFVAIGSWKPDMRELPDAIWKLVDHVYTELPFACEESGDLSQPIEDGLLDASRVRYMGDFLKDKQNGVVAELGDTRFYKSVGMGIFDLMAAKVLIERAREESIGSYVEW